MRYYSYIYEIWFVEYNCDFNSISIKTMTLNKLYYFKRFSISLGGTAETNINAKSGDWCPRWSKIIIKIKSVMTIIIKRYAGSYPIAGYLSSRM